MVKLAKPTLLPKPFIFDSEVIGIYLNYFMDYWSKRLV